MTISDDWRRELPAFWFGLDDEQHWKPNPQLDAEIERRFGEAWEREQARPAADFLAGADDALAAILLFDQVPRNIFRDDARAFVTDALALTIAKEAIALGFDQQVAEDRRAFVYLPFEHSEDMGDQDRSVALFDTLGNELYRDYARKHRDVIVRFGRFPHRNAVLGRTSTPEEVAFGLEPAW